MVRINLLPWRAQRREERKQEFFVMAGAAVVMTLFCLLIVHLVLLGRLHNQMARDNYLQAEITGLDTKIQQVKDIQGQKAQLISRINVIEQLELRREIVVRMFTEMAKIIPDGLYITSVKKVDNKIVITGKAESNTRVSEFMRNIDASPWVTKPVLTEIKDNDDDEKTRDFSLEMEQRSDLPSLTPSPDKTKPDLSATSASAGTGSSTTTSVSESAHGH